MVGSVLNRDGRAWVVFAWEVRGGGTVASLTVVGKFQLQGGHFWIYYCGLTARGERGVGTRWEGVVVTVARHASQCLPAGYVRVV